MGTRNLIIVIKNQEVKIAQYGNSSGYPEVVGLDILNFISIERNLTELTNRLSKRFCCKKLNKLKMDKLIPEFLLNLYSNTHYIFNKVKLTKARTEFISNLAFFHHM